TFRDWRPSTTVTIPSPSGLVVTPLTGSTAEIVILPTVLAVSTPFFGDALPTSAIDGSLEVQTTTDPMFAELPSSRVARALTFVSVPTTWKADAGSTRSDSTRPRTVTVPSAPKADEES